MDSVGNYLILFADLVGSTEVAVEVSPSSYAQTYIASYHWAARRALKYVRSKTIFPGERFRKTIKDLKIAGDEVLSFMPLGKEKGLSKEECKEQHEDIAASAVAFAYVTKLYWLMSPYNLLRMLGNHFPRDIAVGIHIGPAATVPTVEKKEQIASLHINVAKRVESKARDGKESRIFASYEVYDRFKGWLSHVKKDADIKDRSPLSFTNFYRRKELDKIKGVPKKLQLLELQWPTNDTKLIGLLKRLADTPKKEDIATEKAARFLAENFFFHPKKLFSYGKGNTSAISYDESLGYKATDYIDNWFKAVKQLNKLFFDEYWLVLNCYLVSCSLLRHKDVKKADRAKYQRIAKGILARLKQLIMDREATETHVDCPK